jgi:hypothetical protein
LQQRKVRPSTKRYLRFSLAMGSSLGFVSNPCDCGPKGPRPIQTRFRYGSGCHSLNLATEINSPAHSPKGTRSHLPTIPISLGFSVGIVLPLLVSIRFQVLFHSPNRGSFHLSLTVLVHYRSPRVFSLGRWTSLLPTGLACPVVLKVNGGSLDPFRLQGYHLLWRTFPVSFS